MIRDFSVSHLLTIPASFRAVPKLAIIFGIVLKAMEFGAYVATGAQRRQALLWPFSRGAV
jgi:hypothetical protein